MGKNSREKGPSLPPVIKIELNSGNTKLRWIAVALLFLLGICGIGYGIAQSLSVQPGWAEVEYTSRETSVAADFKLMYDFTSAGGSAVAVNKALTQVYSDTAVRAYQVLTSDVQIEGLNNMAFLNAHPNEAVSVEPEVYQALRQVADSGSRQLFLAPAQAEYDRVFVCENQEEAALYDPARNADMRAWLLELSAFTSDPDHIRLTFPEDEKVMLTISPEYLTFAQENGIEIFAAFGWMENAFAADILAEALLAQGFTQGYLASFDGFTRTLGGSQEAMSLNIFARQGSGIDLPARMNYQGSMAIVTLRDYPMSDRDRWNYFTFSDGTILTAFLDPADGMSKSSTHDLVAYSSTQSCGTILLETAELFIADSLNESGLTALTEQNIFALWPQGKTLRYTDKALDLTLLTDYTKEYAGK